jgi:hypothetical protein
MNMSLRALDAEIAEIEARIAAERLALADVVESCKASFKDTATSPKTLMALTGVGFAVGKLMFGRKAPEAAPVAKKVGLLGLLTGVAGTAFGLMQPKFGAGSVARWAMARYFAQRAAAKRAGVPPPPPPPPEVVRAAASTTTKP